MIRLEIKAFGALRELVPQGPMELEEPTSLEGFLTLLAQQCGPEFERQVYDPRAGALNPHICISVNGRVVSGSDLKRQLNQDDRVAVFSLFGGGTFIVLGRFQRQTYLPALREQAGRSALQLMTSGRVAQVFRPANSFRGYKRSRQT